MPSGAVWLKFPELNESLCGMDQVSCGSASRPLLAGVTGAAFSADGRLLSVGAEFWKLGLTCTLEGCLRIWERTPLTLCYALEGSAATQAMGCDGPPQLGAGPPLAQSGPLDGLTFDHGWRRAFFGVPNADAPVRSGQGAALAGHWLGDLSTELTSPDAWALAFASSTAATRTFTALTDPAGARLELLVPPPDALPLADGLIPSSEGVFWATQADDVFELTVSDALRLERRLVRGAITAPQTRTVAVRELAGETLSAVLTASSTTLSGLNAGTVLELSVVRSPRSGRASEPLLAFAPFSAHAPTTRAVAVCFTQPLDDAALSASQFSLAGAEVLAVTALSVPQCVVLSTSPLPRNATLALTIDGVRARSGDVARGFVRSVVAPDAPVVDGVLRLTLPAGVKAVLPLAQTLLVSAGPDAHTLDPGAVASRLLGEPATLPPGGAVSVQADEVVGGLWAGWSTSSGAWEARLHDGAGSRLLGGVASPPRPAGDGTALALGSSGNVVRFSASGFEVLPRVGNNEFRGALSPGRALREVAGRFEVVRLPDTIEATSWAAPTGVSGVPGVAFESGGETWWCGGGKLFRLQDAASLEVAPCVELARDARGVLWATELGTTPRLRRVSGLDVRVVDLMDPLAPGRRLVAPRFLGGAVWHFGENGLALRFEEPVWRALVGETP